MCPPSVDVSAMVEGWHVADALQKWPNNYRRALRAALKEMENASDITPHVFRKSVATLIEAEATLEAAAAVVGHSGTGATSAHYEAKAATAPDVSSILDQFGGKRNEKDG